MAARLARHRWPRLLVAVGIIAADAVMWRLPLPRVVLGAADELCHLGTAGLIVLVSRVMLGEPRRLRLAAALAAAVLIDIDHLPRELFGVDVVTAGTARPYGHSALAILLACALALALRRSATASSVAWGTALGIALHLVRDMPTGGVPLGWPVSATTVSYPYPVYALVLLIAAAWPIRQDSRERQETD